ncbi:unnamed protein product [Bemisia tabaci]|uniref:diacylglycerol O-acyltransferase n=1 Tax=Bemisia tabaci TaxID=7038 RepID=A0AAI8UUB9_BEMTA|nr:unnamed protein product [Bemisia tabaci]
MTAHVVNLMVLVLTPIVALQLYPSYFSLVGASVVCFAYSVIFLKLWSYVHVNSWCREDYQLNTVNKTNVRRQSLSVNKYALSNGKKPPISPPSLNSLVHYPQNLNIRDISYFILAPTLCYELNFPRTDRIRKSHAGGGGRCGRRRRKRRRRRRRRGVVNTTEMYIFIT